MKLLKQIATIRAGYAFRGKIEEDQNGNVHVIQMKDVDVGKGIDWTGLVVTDLPGKKQPDWLKNGDLLFVARGNRNFALLFDEVPFDTVLSPHFFHLTVKRGVNILPGFLAWQINQEPIQHYLQKSSHGSMVQAIGRQVLDNMPVAIPSLEKQQAILSVNHAWQQQLRVMAALTDNMQRTMTGIAKQILREN
ncbi:restriction endonuclease subunit S [Methylovulum miyakonense]|uniref:restriction endonuclease subunit S n=1 Tax=Methylovulum miyakonense TaxID=645578 RepID=UPI0004909B45|nr:restriction endonuclease subunit S [Methylovulum miyakonense]